MSATLRLHNYWRSSCSWRVRIALHHKDLPFEYVAVNLLEGQQHGDEYKAVNPIGMVPTLEVVEGGVTRRLAQSLAILEWLEESYPAKPLLPADRWDRARVRALAELVNSSIQPLHNLLVLGKVEAMGGDKKAWASFFIERGLAALEAEVAKDGGRFCFGDSPTLADVCLVPQLYGARRFGADPSKFPRLLAVESACAALPAFAAAHADRQPDAVAQ